MTVYEYIRQRWPEHAQRIIECMREQDRAGAEYDLVRTVESLKEGFMNNVLGSLFIWGWTVEGHEYWKQVSEQGERVDG